jgi:hypothetical protein
MCDPGTRRSTGHRSRRCRSRPPSKANARASLWPLLPSSRDDPYYSRALVQCDDLFLHPLAGFARGPSFAELTRRRLARRPQVLVTERNRPPGWTRHGSPSSSRVVAQHPLQVVGWPRLNTVTSFAFSLSCSRLALLGAALRHHPSSLGSPGAHRPAAFPSPISRIGCSL